MAEQNLSQLPQRLKQIRSARGLTQSAVAQKIGVNKSTITRWESGKGTNHINRAVIAALADIFDISPSYLLGWIDEPLTRAEEAVDWALSDAGKLYQAIFENPLPQHNTAFNHRILAQVMDINQACLAAPAISEHIGKNEARIGLKYLLAFYGISGQEYSEGLLLRLVDSELMNNFIRNSLNLLKQAAQ